MFINFSFEGSTKSTSEMKREQTPLTKNRLFKTLHLCCSIDSFVFVCLFVFGFVFKALLPFKNCVLNIHDSQIIISPIFVF